MKHEYDHVYTSFVGRHRWAISTALSVLIIMWAVWAWE